MTAPGGVHVSELLAGDHIVTADGTAVVSQITRNADGSTELALTTPGGAARPGLTLPACAEIGRVSTSDYLAGAALAGTGSLR